jgi:hypothetical protein
MQALGMLSGLSIEHVMAMLDAYQACDWMPGEPLKSQLMRILEKVHANAHQKRIHTYIHSRSCTWAPRHTYMHAHIRGCLCKRACMNICACWCSGEMVSS